MSNVNNVALMKDAYIHLCDALDYILRSGRKFDAISVYKDHNGDFIISSLPLKLCEVLFSILNE